jgi:hypothetical protein
MSAAVKTTYENVGMEGDVPGNGNGKFVLSTPGIVYYPAAADSEAAKQKVKFAWGNLAQPSHTITNNTTLLKLVHKSGKIRVFVMKDRAQLLEIDADIRNRIQAHAAKNPTNNLDASIGHDSFTSFTTQIGHDSMRSSTRSARDGRSTAPPKTAPPSNRTDASQKKNDTNMAQRTPTYTPSYAKEPPKQTLEVKSEKIWENRRSQMSNTSNNNSMPDLAPCAGAVSVNSAPKKKNGLHSSNNPRANLHAAQGKNTTTAATEPQSVSRQGLRRTAEEREAKMQAKMGSSKPTARHTDKPHSQGATTTREAGSPPAVIQDTQPPIAGNHHQLAEEVIQDTHPPIAGKHHQVAEEAHTSLASPSFKALTSQASSRFTADPVEAWTVTEEPEANTVQEAQQVDLSELAGELVQKAIKEQTVILTEQNDRKRRRVVYGLVAFFLIGLAITLGVVFGTREPANNNNSGPSTDTKTSSGSGSDTSSLPNTDENEGCGIVVAFQLVYESGLYFNEVVLEDYFSNWVNASQQAFADFLSAEVIKKEPVWELPSPTVFTLFTNESSRNEYVGSVLGDYQVFWDVVSGALFDYSKNPDCLRPNIADFENLAINDFLWSDLIRRANTAVSPSTPTDVSGGPIDLLTYPFRQISWSVLKILYSEDVDAYLEDGDEN